MGILRLNVRCFFFVCLFSKGWSHICSRLFVFIHVTCQNVLILPSSHLSRPLWVMHYKTSKRLFFFLPKQKHLFFLFFVFVLVPASQRGEAYSTPRNWCLIKSSFLMWDVVTWFYFFVSPSVKTRRKKTKHRRLRMDIWTHGTLTVNNLLVISIWKVWFSGMIVKHYIQKGALLSSLSISRPTSVSQIIMFLFGNASKHRQSRRRWWSEWTLNT